LAQVLPFATHSFDSIIATFPTEYIVDPGSLKEIRRVLCPGGVLVIVLGAWITGRSFLDRSAAWLFHITGQSPDWNPFYADPLTQAGFSVEQHFIHLSGSYVLVLVAS
jgi:SAM-dependent methyltransferase